MSSRPVTKLALILYGIDAEETQRPDTVTNITVDNASIGAQQCRCFFKVKNIWS